MRLIDADSIHYTRVLSQQGLNMELAAKVVIDDMPTIDAAPVVRCKDCVHRGLPKCPMCHDEDDGAEYYTVDRTDDYGFCHCGARMDKEE